MTLERPLLLLALLSVPLLYLLARNLRERRAVPVSSLFIFRRLGLSPAPPQDVARRADRLLLLRLLAAGLVALGLSGPRVTAGLPDPVIEVLIDSSPSMGAFRDGVSDALDTIRSQVPSGMGLRVTRSTVDGGLRDLLAGPGRGDIVVVTDHSHPGLEGSGRVREFLVGTPVENLGITAAWLADGRFGAVVTSFASAPLSFTIRYPGRSASTGIEPGSSLVFAGPLTWDRAEIELDPGDAFRFDDRVVLVVTPPAVPALRWEGPEEPALALALAAAGVKVDPDASGAVCYRTGPGEEARLVVAPPGPKRNVDLGSVTASGGLPAEACPPPGLPLGRATVLGARGTVILADGDGPLAVADGPTITLALDPGDPRSRWARDPSFPVFVAELARLLGAGGPGFEVREGVIDPVESATKPASRIPRLIGLTPSAGETGRGLGLAGILFVLAGVILLLHFVIEAGWGGRWTNRRWDSEAPGVPRNR